jgi:hypothetical protein
MFIVQMDHDSVVPKAHGLKTSMGNMSIPLKSSQMR